VEKNLLMRGSRVVKLNQMKRESQRMKKSLMLLREKTNQ
jgi:hypothetical protein